MHYGFPYKVIYTQYLSCIASHISNTVLSLYLNSLSLILSLGGAEVDQRHCVCLLIITDCCERLSTDRLHECENIQTVWKSSRCDGKVTNRLVLHMNSLLRIFLVNWYSLAVKGIVQLEMKTPSVIHLYVVETDTEILLPWSMTSPEIKEVYQIGINMGIFTHSTTVHKIIYFVQSLSIFM